MSDDSKNSANRARSRAIRARMAETGENWTVAARHVTESASATGSREGTAASGEQYSTAARGSAATAPMASAGGVREVTACADRTLAAPSARISVRVDTEFILPERQSPSPPGPIGRLARLAAKATWERLAPDWDTARLREAFEHQAGEGYLLPAAGRYMIDFGGYAEMYLDGKRFGGPPGQSVRGRRWNYRAPRPADDPLGLLRLLQGVTDSRHTGEEVLRGTRCQVFAVRAGSAEFTVWTDGERIRRTLSEEHASQGNTRVSKKRRIELWDFGAPVGSLDWSHLPRFTVPG